MRNGNGGAARGTLSTHVGVLPSARPAFAADRSTMRTADAAGAAGAVAPAPRSPGSGTGGFCSAARAGLRRKPAARAAAMIPAHTSQSGRIVGCVALCIALATPAHQHALTHPRARTSADSSATHTGTCSAASTQPSLPQTKRRCDTRMALSSRTTSSYATCDGPLVMPGVRRGALAPRVPRPSCRVTGGDGVRTAVVRAQAWRQLTDR